MAKRFTAEYAAEDILQLYQIRKEEGDEQRIRSIADTMRQLTRLEHSVKVPKQYRAISKQIRTPFVRDSWHRITSSLVSKPPVAHITPKDEDKQEYRDAANTAERADMGMIERINKEQSTDIVYDSTAQFVRDGESVLNVVHRPNAWANFPERGDEDADTYQRNVRDYKRGSDLPIAWRVVDRKCIVYEGGDYGSEWLIEYGEYAQAYLKNRYQMTQDNYGRLVNPRRMEGPEMPEGLCASGTGRSVKVQFWTPREWHVLVDGSEAPGYPKPNPYNPYIPYFRARAYESESLLYSLMYLVPALDAALTMKHTWGVIGAYPNPVIQTIPNSSGLPQLDGPLGNAGDLVAASGDRPKPMRWEPGKQIELPVGKSISFLVPPPVGEDLNDMVVILKDLIDIAGIPSIMRGVSGSGDSGYLASQLRAAAEMAYKLALIALSRQLEQAMEFSHWLVPNVIKQSVYVMGWSDTNTKTGKPTRDAKREWLGFAPKPDEGKKLPKNVADVSMLGPVTFQYRPTLPTDEQARAMIALQLTNATKPLYDRRNALETWMQEEDPDSILDALAVEQAMEEEPLRSMMIQNALEEAGILPVQQGGSGLVDQYGQPMGQNTVPPGTGQLQPVPLNNMPLTAMQGVPGLTMPMQPSPPGAPGIPGNTGGRAAGTYPGRPSGPQMR